MTAVKKGQQSSSRSKRTMPVGQRTKASRKQNKRVRFARPGDGPPTTAGDKNG